MITIIVASTLVPITLALSIASWLKLIELQKRLKEQLKEQQAKAAEIDGYMQRNSLTLVKVCEAFDQKINLLSAILQEIELRVSRIDGLESPSKNKGN